MDTIYRNRLLLGIAAMVILITPVAVYAASFLDIRLGAVYTSSNKVDRLALVTKASIPKDGNSGAFGYGVITGESVIVTTTHKGVLDSEAQNNENDPIFHNHYVRLGDDPQGRCGTDPAVLAITFDSPGKVQVGGQAAELSELPKSSEGISQNSDVDKVVSFKLKPTNGAVCVTDIKPAEKQKVF
jgi:hypothetical protein